MSSVTIGGMTIFDLFDYVTANIMLPIGSILLCVYLGWVAKKQLFKDQLTNNGSLTAHSYRIVLFIVRYIAPILIAGILISSFINNE